VVLKTFIPTPQINSLEIRRGISKAKIVRGKYEAKQEFPGGVGVQTRKTIRWGVWIFSGTTQKKNLVQNFSGLISFLRLD